MSNRKLRLRSVQLFEDQDAQARELAEALNVPKSDLIRGFVACGLARVEDEGGISSNNAFLQEVLASGSASGSKRSW